jgi:hypothetical protein
MDRAIHCRQHGLSIKTFGRWMNHLISKEEALKHAEYLLELRREERRRQRRKNGKRRQKQHYAVSTDIRSRSRPGGFTMIDRSARSEGGSNRG